MDNILQSPELQAALTNLILAIISLATVFITKVGYSYISTNTTANQFALLSQFADSAVAAAEQGAIAGFVTDRKATAMAIVNNSLASAGIKNVSAEQIDAAIEAAVKETLNYKKQFGDKAPVVQVVVEGDQNVD